MSETTAYLIPKKQFELGDFKSRVETSFASLELINGYYNKDYNWFGAGKKAHLFFEDKESLFEYVEIHDTENQRLIPDGVYEMVECQFCHTDIKEEVNDLLYTITEKEFHEKNETDIANAVLVCPNCGQTSNLPSLVYHEKIVFANQYICFVAILDDINKEKLVELEKEIDTSFEILYGSI